MRDHKQNPRLREARPFTRAPGRLCAWQLEDKQTGQLVWVREGMNITGPPPQWGARMLEGALKAPCGAQSLQGRLITCG